MIPANVPANEAQRIAALHALDVLDSGPEEEFDSLVRVASLVCDVPISLISLVDTERQWFKANIGLPGASETPRDIAFCSHAILDDGLFEVRDAAQDQRFFDNPLVIEQPDIRFYAGEPIVLSDGHRIGTLCVIDRTPRQLDVKQREILHSLAVAAAQALEGRRAMREQRRLSLELLSSQERFRLAVESGGIGIWEFDLTTGVLQWDAQVYRLYGLEPTDTAGAYALWAERLHPEDKPEAERALQHAIATGERFDSEFRVIWPNGAIRHLKGYGKVYQDAQGRAVRVIGTNWDVTQGANILQDLKLARDEAQAASQSKGQFLANMSHEIRTPMNAIHGLLNLLQTTELTARQADYVNKTEGAAHSLLGLLNDILDFSKVEAGKMTLESEPFFIDQLLRNISVLLSANVGSKKVEVLFDIDPEIPKALMGDAMRLQQVLINLGGNAVKFTEEGHVVLRLRTKAMSASKVAIEFAVSDTGIGIAPEHQVHIFSGFTQAEGSTTRRFGGTGLGLAISQQLVGLMGGNIKITSAPGEGSIFSFIIEMPTVADLPPTLAVAQSPELLPGCILVIDDSPVAGPLVERMIRSWGVEVDVATSGAQALERIAARHGDSSTSFPYSTVFVDWQMPGMDGWETTQRIRKIANQYEGAAPCIIMLTAYGRETLALRSESEQAMINGFLVKPVTASMLLEAITDAANGKDGVRRKSLGRSSQRQLNGMRILVVEDNLLNQQVAEELLTAEGAIVSLAANGQLGVDAVRQAAPQFDAVLMDVQMPVLDGYAATRKIREELALADLPVIAMTANAMSGDREVCIKAGMNEHIGKPFDLRKLVSLLIRMTGYAATAEPTLEPSATQASDLGIEIVGLDLKGALQRMSGMRALYVRSARDFVKALDAAPVELRHCLNVKDQGLALRCLHTLKGNAATLGAMELAQKAAALEALCKVEFESNAFLEGIEALGAVIETDKDRLNQALEKFELLPSATKTNDGAGMPKVDHTKLLPALQRFSEMLAQADMEALQLFAEMRLDLDCLHRPEVEKIDEAMQELEFDSAHGFCDQLIRSLSIQTS